MTIPEFIARLKATPGPWKVYDDGCIRSGDHCPLTAIAASIDPDTVQHADDWTDAADILEIVFADALTIVDAADGESDEQDSDEYVIRQQLLAATVNRQAEGPRSEPEDSNRT